MKKIKQIILFIGIIFTLLSISFADVGDWNSYDSYDSYDYSSNDDYDYSWNDYDDDYSYSDNDFSSSGSSELDGVWGSIIAIFIVGITIYEMAISLSRSMARTKSRRINEPVTKNLLSIKKLEESDPNFNQDEFLQWVDSVFMELQTAWTNKDLEKIKTLEDNALYGTHKAQLERYIKDRKTNYIERIAIRDKKINGYKEKNGFEYIDITLIVEMVDYIKNDITGKVLKGRTEDRVTMAYNIVFKRKKGVVTNKVGELETVNCPSCGAPIDISASAVCEYCNNVINTSNHSWVISQYRGQNIYITIDR